MLYGIIDLVANVVSIFICVGFIVCMVIFIVKRSCKKKGDKSGLKQIEKIELKLKEIGKGVWKFFFMFLVMSLCSILALAIKPIIYKLNVSLGEGYATFSSYIIAICLWILLKPKNAK